LGTAVKFGTTIWSVRSPLFSVPLCAKPLDISKVSRLAPLVPTQVLKDRLALTGFSDGKHPVHGWGDDAVAALPEILRMAGG